MLVSLARLQRNERMHTCLTSAGGWAQSSQTAAASTPAAVARVPPAAHKSLEPAALVRALRQASRCLAMHSPDTVRMPESATSSEHHGSCQVQCVQVEAVRMRN